MLRACATGMLLAALAAGQPSRQAPSHFSVPAESPFPVSCNGAQNGRNFRNGAVEPWIAADPRDPLHLVGAWQQDRWSNGGASGLVAAVTFDGGRTWTRSLPPVSVCGGGRGFNRASDPWVSISPDGTVHLMSLSLGGPGSTHALLATRSRDGGLTWSEPIAVVQEPGPDVLNDKETLTADPFDSNYVYAVWDRVSGLTNPNPNNHRGPIRFARSSDGGETWEPPRTIYDPGANAQTIGNQIVVLSDGTLVNGFVSIKNASAPLARDMRLQLAVLRSTDRGLTWSEPIVVTDNQPVGVSSVKTGMPVRSAPFVPALASDMTSGAVYIVWQDGRLNGGLREGVLFSRSTDGGLNWSTPRQINQVADVQAFTPAIAVAPNGTIAVVYNDFRKDTDERSVLIASTWRLVSTDGGESWTEAPLGVPFDLAQASVTDGGGYFVGDYQGLASSENGFVSFFATSTGLVAALRPSATDRSWNGRTEINRYALRRRIPRK